MLRKERAPKEFTKCTMKYLPNLVESLWHTLKCGVRHTLLRIFSSDQCFHTQKKFKTMVGNVLAAFPLIINHHECPGGPFTCNHCYLRDEY